MNEAVIRSPKWLRNIADFEINTGEDIKGKPSKRRQKKLDFEESEKRRIAEEERLQREYQRREQEREQQRQKERIKQDEDNKKKEKFQILFDNVSSYIMTKYKDCKIDIPKANFLTIENNNLKVAGEYFEFKVTLNNTINIPTFESEIKHGNLKYSYTVSGLGYIDLKRFFVNTIYDWYKGESYYNQGKNKQSKSGSGSSGSGSSGSGYYSGSNSKQSSYEKTKPGESDEVKNKRRRYILLKDTLDGFKRELQKLIDWEKSNPGQSKESDKEIVRNQITNVKDKINIMNKKYQFESLYYLKHLQSIFS